MCILLMGLLLTSFFKASFTAPGYVYAGWEEEYAGTDWYAIVAGSVEKLELRHQNA